MPQYQPNGALFKNHKKATDKQPDYNGSLEFSAEVVTDLWHQLQEGGQDNPKVDLAVWVRQSKKGTNFMSLIANIPYKRKTQAQPNPRQGQGSYDDRGQTSAPAPLDDEIPF